MEAQDHQAALLARGDPFKLGSLVATTGSSTANFTLSNYTPATYNTASSLR